MKKLDINIKKRSYMSSQDFKNKDKKNISTSKSIPFIETISDEDMQNFLVWTKSEKNLIFTNYGVGFFENSEIQILFLEFINTKKAS